MVGSGCLWQAFLLLGNDRVLTSGFRSDCRRSPQVCLDSLPCILHLWLFPGRLGWEVRNRGAGHFSYSEEHIFRWLCYFSWGLGDCMVLAEVQPTCLAFSPMSSCMSCCHRLLECLRVPVTVLCGWMKLNKWCFLWKAESRTREFVRNNWRHEIKENAKLVRSVWQGSVSEVHVKFEESSACLRKKTVKERMSLQTHRQGN